MIPTRREAFRLVFACWSRVSLGASQLNKTPGCISADWAWHAVWPERKPSQRHIKPPRRLSKHQLGGSMQTFQQELKRSTLYLLEVPLSITEQLLLCSILPSWFRRFGYFYSSFFHWGLTWDRLFVYKDVSAVRLCWKTTLINDEWTLARFRFTSGKHSTFIADAFSAETFILAREWLLCFSSVL